MGLDLYARIEPYLEFDEQVRSLHKAFLEFIFTHNLNNIIDIGCGQGAFLAHLTANGVENYGIDLSAEQIKVCQSLGLHAQHKALSDVSQHFDCATAIFDVINYLPSQEIHTFFQQTYNILNDKGYFIFDVNTFFGFDEIAQGSINMDLNDKFIAIDAYFDEEQLSTHLTLFEKQAKGLFHKEHDEIIQYYHETTFLKQQLQAVGFAVQEVRNFYLHCEEEADKLLFICQK